MKNQNIKLTIFLIWCMLSIVSMLVSFFTEPTKKEKKQAKIYYGIDLAKWNGNIFKEAELLDNISFMICKATEGMTKDSLFEKNWIFIKQRKMIRGVYHVYQINGSPDKQAYYFWSIVKKLDSLDMALIINIEEHKPNSHQGCVEQLQMDFVNFLEIIQNKSKKTPIIYTNYSFAESYLTNPYFEKYPLWLIEYQGITKPFLPRTWKEKGCKVWQKSAKYNILSDELDFDVFYGILEELYL
ncbi:MAG: hypothetical protein MUC49_14305 [Raineya sp.]|jgi:GH25 family lysozyme M1 (1,4-beta-N-acetylmuramidase)|nr:hypothetical protein [Raineya sp.]